jgi:hypothetical protein
VKFVRILLVLFLVVIGGAACGSPIATEEQPPDLPTAKVPPITEIDAAIERWKSSDQTRYASEVTERTLNQESKIRLVIADGVIRTAQRLTKTDDGSWTEPIPLSPAEAQAYTVDAILERVRTDSLGNGPSRFNISAVFDETLGYVTAAHAESLPTYNEEGDLILNRDYSYDLSSEVRPLLEDTIGAGEQPLFTYLRNGSPAAWCETLRIFPDGVSYFTDDCLNEVLQASVPASRMEALDALRASFASLDDIRATEGQEERLIITGSGEGTPDTNSLEAAWDLAAELHALLSEPLGLGLTATYVYNGQVTGFDIYNRTTLTADIQTDGAVRAALLTQDGTKMALSDDVGLKILNTSSSTITPLLSHPEEGYYLPRAWSASNQQLTASIMPESSDAEFQIGSILVEEKNWQPLPTLESSSGYGCDTGVSWSPDSDRMAISGLEYGDPCNTTPGLIVIDLSNDQATQIVAPTIQAGTEGGEALLAGAHTPAWSPDGEWIAFGLDQDAVQPLVFPTRLYRIHPDGSSLTPLTNNSQGVAAYPVWKRDGTLYYSLSGASSDTDGIYRYNPSDNTHTMLIPGANLHPLSISPDDEFLIYEEISELKIWQLRLNETVATISGEEGNFPVFAGWFLANQ